MELDTVMGFAIPVFPDRPQLLILFSCTAKKVYELSLMRYGLGDVSVYGCLLSKNVVCMACL